MSGDAVAIFQQWTRSAYPISELANEISASVATANKFRITDVGQSVAVQQIRGGAAIGVPRRSARVARANPPNERWGAKIATTSSTNNGVVHRWGHSPMHWRRYSSRAPHA